MSGSHSHPYHLVNPSPWPMLSSFALLAVAIGAGMAMHNTAGGVPILIGGLLVTLYCMYAWWRDVVEEANDNVSHTSPVMAGLRVGMVLFIVSEIMFFAAFFWAFFNASLFPIAPLEEVWDIAQGVWPPAGIETFDAWHLPFLNTLILLLSGTTCTWAHHAMMHNNRDDLIKALWYTVGLGFLFSLMQAYEYSHAAFGFKDGIYASTFYLATGFHGLHVIIGTIFLAVCLLRVYRGHFTAEKHLGFEFAAWYWHFVDVVWLFLFVFVYWWGG